MGNPLFVSVCLLLFKEPSPCFPTERRSGEKDFKKRSEFLNFHSSESRSFKRPQWDYFNRGNLFSVYPKWFIKSLAIPLLHTRGNLLSVDLQKPGSRGALSFLQFPIDFLPGACHKSHNPSYILHLSTSQGSQYLAWVCLSPFSTLCTCFWSVKPKFLCFSSGFHVSEISISVFCCFSFPQRIYPAMTTPHWVLGGNYQDKWCKRSFSLISEE